MDNASHRLPRLPRGRTFGLARALCLVSALLAPATSDAANRDQLRIIVEDQCAPHWARDRNPAPCRSVTSGTPDHPSGGYAVLHDITGGAHYLLIPIETLPGIETPELLAPGATNFFEAAWQARDSLATDTGRPVPDDAVALAVNSALARTQDQLHVHVSCQRESVHDALASMADRIDADWGPILLSTGPYEALRVMGNSLAGANPFKLLAERLPSAKENMGRYSLMVAAMNFGEGPGFIVLAGSGVPGSAMLLDPECTLATRPDHSQPRPPASQR